MSAATITLISRSDLVKLLHSLVGAKFVTFTAKTDAKLKKRDNPFGQVWKVNRVNVCVNFHYEPGVLRRLEAEGKTEDDFRRGESWHQPVVARDGKLTPFCQHKETGDLYLRAQHLHTIGEPVYVDDAGREVDVEEIKPFFQSKGTPYKNQGLTEPLRFVTYKLDGIQSITVDGVTYEVGED